jgi:hypothetical protein
VRQVLLCELVRYGNVAVQKVVWTYMRFKDGDAKVLSFLASRLALCNAGKRQTHDIERQQRLLLVV